MVDQEKIDTYILSRMRAANIPGLALGVVRGDQVVYLKGYGIAGPNGRVVTPRPLSFLARPRNPSPPWQ